VNGRAFGFILAAAALTLSGAAPPQSAPAAGQDDFVRIRPLLAKYCHSCHGDKPKPKADLNMVRFGTEAALKAERKLWKGILEKTATHEMPPEEHKTQPTAADRDAIVRTLEFILKKPDPNAAPSPGRVTLRRLNRAEYSNTIRDLVGVDFNPAEDFPSDDIGHGFDNIGDVLTLPPVLMERYLAAADAVVQRVFPAETPKPSEKRTSAKYLEPAGGNVAQTKFRPVLQTKGDPVRTGPIHQQMRLDPEGEYTFRFRAFRKNGPVKVAVLLSGKGVQKPASDAEIATLAGAALNGLRPFRILGTHEIKAEAEDKAERIEVKIPPTAGVERIALALVKGEAKEPAPELWLEGFQVTGPLDPRPSFQRKVLNAVAGKPRNEQAREILRGFATRAYRRPVSESELGRLVSKVDQVVAGGGTLEAGLQIAFQAVLVSPKFLFRVELDDRPVAGGVQPLGDFALASRLSYFLWASMPDEELLGLAAQNKLAANLEAQARRMLKDPRSRSLVDQFAMQWLQLKRLGFVAPDGQLFPSFNQRLRQAMIRETELFVDSVIREDRSVLDLIDADYTFLNERLARHYGIADTAGNRLGGKPERPGGKPIPQDDFVRVSLPNKERGGLITQASVLTVTSNPTRTSPVKRGRWVLEQIMGTPPPPPPPDAPELPEVKQEEAKGSLRQRLEQHRADPRCANCHTRMDAIGFALENYNAVGAWRVKDGAFDVDPAGVFPDGTSFNGVKDLKGILMQKKDGFVRCISEKLLIYALGRGLEPYDDAAVDRIVAGVVKENYRFSAVVAEIVKSDPFRLRKAAVKE
jgi:hypothetical protein